MIKYKNKIIVWSVSIVFCILCIFNWVFPDGEYSTAERRSLKQKPKVNLEEIVSGRFMSQFEAYTLDQFPLRNVFRSLKAISSPKADNNGIYVVDNVINSMDYPLNETNLKYASERFQRVYDMYLKDNNCSVYLSIIPDKNYFYAEDNGYLAYDYKQLVSIMKQENPNFTYIDILPLLSKEDYYDTDTHWRQDKISDVSYELIKKMNKSFSFVYDEVTMPEKFYGVYYGQAALPLKPDTIIYLNNDIINNYKVFDYQNDKTIPVYDETKMISNDPYELFVGGPISLCTIENPNYEREKHLIIFRDSFGSSIAPLLAQGYSKTTLVDIRYILPAMLERYVDFKDADVLFLYSTMVLNNSETLK